MLTIAQAFDRMRRDLELSTPEKANVQRHQNTVRDALKRHLTLSRHFLTGSYDRRTAIRPLNDVDFFVVLNPDTHGDLQQKDPSKCLLIVRDALWEHYGRLPSIRLQNRSVNIQFSGRNIGYDVVPAFVVHGSNIYDIPDRERGTWIRSSPERHLDRLKAANRRCGSKLKPLIKMAKCWNVHHSKPLSSFHLESMSIRALSSAPPSYAEGIAILFEALSTAVRESCPDPAKVGPNIDARLKPGRRQNAENVLRNAARQARRALRGEGEHGDIGGAHHVWRSLLGDTYPERGTQPSTW